MAGDDQTVDVAVAPETAQRRWTEFAARELGGGDRGEASFEALGEDRTRVTVRVQEGPPGGLDLERFKAFAEGAGAGGAYSTPGDAGAPLSDEGTTTGTSPGTPGELSDADAGGPNPPPRREQPGL